MNPRRSLTDALQLTPEKRAFINGEPLKPLLPENAVRPPAPPNRPDDPMLDEKHCDPVSVQHTFSATGIRPISKQTSRPSSSRVPKESAPITKAPELFDGVGLALNNILIPLTTRLQPRTALALKRASLQQRLRGQEPGTVQEIVEIAIVHWLGSRGYLQPP